MIFPCVISCDFSSVPLFCCAWNPNIFKRLEDLHLYHSVSICRRIEVVDLLFCGEKKWDSGPLFESHSLFVFFALPPEVSYTQRSLKKNLMVFC